MQQRDESLVLLLKSMSCVFIAEYCGGLQEDRRLQKVMTELGGTSGTGFSWSAVAKRLGGGRTGKSCRLR